MIRNADVIQFDEFERREFNLPPAESAAMAAQTADTFLDVARQLQSRADERAGTANTAEIGRARHDAARAARLHDVATKIIPLVMDEYLELIAQQSQEPA